MKLKGYIIKESDAKVVILDSTGIYKIKSTGDIIEYKFLSGDYKNVVVKDWNDIIKLNKKEVLDYVEHRESKNRYTEVEYLEAEKEVLDKRVCYEGEYSTYSWASLDDEFNYKKFVASYSKVYKTIYTEEEVVVEAIKEVLLETHNPFIKGGFVTGFDYFMFDVYTYLRPQAVMQILKDKMKSIGAEYLGDDGIVVSKTEGRLAWTLTSHSGIRFARFAGKYIFSDTWDVRHVRKGTLEQMTSDYEADKKAIEAIIDYAHLKEFGQYTTEGTKAVSESLNKLDDAISKLGSIKASVKTSHNQLSCGNLLRQVKELLLSTLKV